MKRKKNAFVSFCFFSTFDAFTSGVVLRKVSFFLVEVIS